MSGAVDWVEGATKRTLNLGQRRCIDTLCSTDNPWNMPLINDGWSSTVDYSIHLPSPNPYEDDPDECDATPAVLVHEGFILVRLRSTMSTFDCERLTTIVLAAHQHRVRVQVSSGFYVYEAEDSERFDYNASGVWESTGEPERGFGHCLEIQLNPREPEGRLFDRHPGLDDLAEHISGMSG